MIGLIINGILYVLKTGRRVWICLYAMAHIGRLGGGLSAGRERAYRVEYLRP